MSGRAQIDGFIQRFGKERDLALDPLNAQGYAEIARGSAVVRINVVEEHGVVLLIAPIMRVPERNAEAFYRRLLELSFLATSDAAFAIDKKTDMAYLRALLQVWRGHARDRGSITLEWMVVIGILFAAAVWAATKIVSAIHSHANQIK